ncbi:hypothetical protein pdam_00016583 [Pocillopora damicornis]|uniref:UTP25 NTP hydrolase-like domain-containing protein n=1 Tax=Pocillopora damicornis TaxID=46731 RepID=A0A3M6TGQ5_POCDA|nr:hypothetical protein pdam_00016583 [Pocillopora damicornis]
MGNGGWEMENEKWRMGNGGWEMENGKWRVGNGEWETENGKWRMGNGEWAVGNGNIDEYFRNGISVMKKCVKLYAKYPSVVTVASPLGLRMMIIGSAGYF